MFPLLILLPFLAIFLWYDLRSLTRIDIGGAAGRTRRDAGPHREIRGATRGIDRDEAPAGHGK